MKRRLVFGWGLWLALGLVLLLPPSAEAMPPTTLHLLVTDCSSSNNVLAETTLGFFVYRNGVLITPPTTLTTDSFGLVSFSPAVRVKWDDVCRVSLSPTDPTEANSRDFVFVATPPIEDLFWQPTPNPFGGDCGPGDCSTTPRVEIDGWQVRFLAQ